MRRFYARALHLPQRRYLSNNIVRLEDKEQKSTSISSGKKTMRSALFFYNEHYNTEQSEKEINDEGWELVTPEEMRAEIGRPLNSSDFSPENGESRAYAAMKRILARKQGIK
jgi:hypothetical protein